MKFTLSWLKDHLETNASLNEIVDALTAIGLEVEEVDDRSAMKAFTIARVLTAEKHPDADKLQVLSVDVGDGKPLQVVCGAPNARAGLVGVFGAPGTYVPGLDVTLSIGKIRGVESMGMMCSERELELSDEHNGIIELPTDAPVGQSFATYAHLDDPIIDVSITPNRPDCTGVYGIARDLAAYGIGTLKPLKTPEIKTEGAPCVDVKLDFADSEPLCLGFAWRVIKGVKNIASPKWMQNRLMAIGLRPINALVDMTNYITFDLGRPLHVFDADKIKGALTVRRGRQGDKLLALNNKEYELHHNNCVIADDNGVLSIAGIIGGETTGVDENTTNVAIESALWEARNIATTGREFGVITDARYRFERGVDPEFMVSGLEFATQMALDLCGGTASESKVIGYKGYTPKEISFPFGEIKRLTSLDVPHSEATSILNRLGFDVKGNGDIVNVFVPSWRPDIEGKADLVEEVMRIYGINKIIPQPMEKLSAINSRILTPIQSRSHNAKRMLASRGMLEAVTYSFISEKAAKLFHGGEAKLRLVNPISSDMTDMRPSLLPSLIAATNRNNARGFSDIALFEVSNIYEGDEPSQQRRVASGIRRGTTKLDGSGRFWAQNSANVDVFDAKADAFAVIDACGMDSSKLQVEANAPDWYHPGRSGVIKLGPKVVIGHFGEFHPDILDALDASGSICGFEVFLDALPEAKKKPTKTRPPLTLSPFQMVYRDFAFVVDESVSSASIIRAASGADKKLIQSVQVFDLFSGTSIGEGKKSVAIEVAIQPIERTLTEEDFEALATKIIDNVIKSTGGTLRA